ncbi:MAG: LacI family transcriptional regulator [Eubacterium sp.]|nr:LacI family transcriptional regulator [Eubacterium sp.]
MSLKKIAQMTGASVATVSRVLNNPDYQCKDQDLTKRIRKAARELSYVPDQNARQLKMSGRGKQGKAKQYAIDILLARFHSLEEDPFFAELYRHIETECYKQNCVLGQVLNVPDISLLSAAAGRVRADGILVLGKCPQQAADVILRKYRGVAAVDRNPMDYRMDEVTCNGAHAAAMAVEYLLELGHTSIAYIGDCTMEARYSGYYECLLNHKISMIYEYIVSTNQTREEGYQAFSRLAALHKPPTAVFCANDVTALGFLQAMKDANGRRKKQAYRPAVISIDDIEEAVRCSPMLTTIRIPKGDMAHLAVLTLKDRLQGGHQACVRMELPCHLLVRESAGMYVT